MSISPTLAEQHAQIAAGVASATVEPRCGDCGHRWVAAYLPLDMARAGELLKAARCPFGCDGQVFVQ